MRIVQIFLLAVACLGAGSLLAWALPVEKTRAVINRPMLMANGSSSRMQVVFNHDKHLGSSCLTCHHMMAPDREVFTSCNSGFVCHGDTRLEARGVSSYFQAIHKPDSAQSCRGCHLSKAATRPELAGCQCCHDSTERAGAERTFLPRSQTRSGGSIIPADTKAVKTDIRPVPTGQVVKP